MNEQPDAVGDRVWRIALPFRDHPSNCYLIADDAGDLHIVDPGSDTEGNRARLLRGLAAMGAARDRVRTVTATHAHVDHLGLAGWLKRGGAQLLVHELDSALPVGTRTWADAHNLRDWGVPTDVMEDLRRVDRDLWRPIEPADSALHDGEVLPIPGRTLRVIHTPGHTVGSICILDEAAGLLFTGDHILPRQFPGVGLGAAHPTNAMGEYLASVERIAGLDAIMLAGHGAAPFPGLAERCDATLRHHRDRAAQVARLLAAEPAASVWQLARRLSWSGGWAGLAGVRLGSALQQTALHRERILAGV